MVTDGDDAAARLAALGPLVAIARAREPMLAAIVERRRRALREVVARFRRQPTGGVEVVTDADELSDGDGLAILHLLRPPDETWPVTLADVADGRLLVSGEGHADLATVMPGSGIEALKLTLRWRRASDPPHLVDVGPGLRLGPALDGVTEDDEDLRQVREALEFCRHRATSEATHGVDLAALEAAHPRLLALATAHGVAADEARDRGEPTPAVGDDLAAELAGAPAIAAVALGVGWAGEGWVEVAEALRGRPELRVRAEAPGPDGGIAVD